MLTTKKRVQFLLLFSVGFLILGSWVGCVPAGARALKKGERLVREGKYAEAVQKFEEASKAYPNNAKAWNHLGHGYQLAGDPKNAVRAYERALSLDPNFGVARYNLGTLHFEQRNFPAAVSELITFTQLQPKNARGWLRLGQAQMQHANGITGAEKNRQFDAAKRSLDFAHKLQPSAEALNAMGLLSVQRGRARDAVPSFNAALQQQSNYAPALLNLAVVYHLPLNDKRLALVNYRQFLDAAKNGPEIARVQGAVRQLENELKQQGIVTNSVVVSNRSPETSTVSLPRVETNASKPLVAKPLETNAVRTTVVAKVQTPSFPPKAPPPIKREPPVEVAILPDEVPIKPAQEIVETDDLISSNAPAPSQVRSAAPEKGSSVLTKMNPVTWFKRKPKTRSGITDLPSTGLNVDAGSDSAGLLKTPESGTNSNALNIPQYKYRAPKRHREGNRAKADPFFRRGIQAQRDRRLADALENYRQAIRNDPTFYEAHYNFALASREASNFAAALSGYEEALAIMPESVNARYNFAFTLQEAGYFLDAVNELQKVLAQNADEARAHLLLGNIYSQRLNQNANAKTHYVKVLAAEPLHPQAGQIRYWLAAHP